MPYNFKCRNEAFYTQPSTVFSKLICDGSDGATPALSVICARAAASKGRGRLEPSNYHQSSNSNFGDSHPQSQLPAQTTEQKQSTPDEWATWNLKRLNSLSEFEGDHTSFCLS